MLKTKTKVKISLAGLMLAVSAFLFNFPWESSFAEACTTSPCNTTFQVNVVESLSVSITTPSTWASGDVDEFLRNKVTLDVSTNNANGFAAYIRSRNNTNLTNAVSSSNYITTLGSSTQRGGFTANHWGYSLGTPSYNSLNYGETDAGVSSSYYYPMSTSSIKILDSTAGNSRDVYFGAKANSAQASGTYLGTVVFTVISGSVNPDDPTPDNPASPTDDTPNDSQATYDSTNNRTVYTTTSSSGSGATATSTTTTQVSSGDTTGMYQSPHGETRRTESNVSDGSQVATGLAVAASTAAAGGMVFFILAKRREEDEEDEEELQ